MKVEPREHKLFDWMVIQAMHTELGILDEVKITRLEGVVPNWFEKYSEEFHNALACDNDEIQQEFVTWWNAEGLSESAMSYVEIQNMAGLEAPSN